MFHIPFTPNEKFPKFTAHTTEGIKQFDNEIDAHMATHHVTSNELISACGVLGGMGMNHGLLIEMMEFVGCPDPHECAFIVTMHEREIREAFNASLEDY